MRIPLKEGRGFSHVPASRPCTQVGVMDAFAAQERMEVRKLHPAPAPGAATVSGRETFDPDEELAEAEAQVAAREAHAATHDGAGAAGPTSEQLTAIKAAIAAASTLDEVRRLESALVSGQLPSEFREDDGAAQPMQEG